MKVSVRVHMSTLEMRDIYSLNLKERRIGWMITGGKCDCIQETVRKIHI